MEAPEGGCPGKPRKDRLVLTRNDGTGPHPVVGKLKPRLRRRLTIAISGGLLAVFAAASVLTILGEMRAREAQIERLRAAAGNLTQVLDREVARFHALLLGLESSPALRSRDLQAFHRQLTETKVPEGAWLVLSDREKLVLHSLRPFGSPLPSLYDFTPQPQFFRRLDKLDFSLTGRVQGVLFDTIAATVNRRVDDPDGGWRYFLTIVLSDQHLLTVVQQQQTPRFMGGAIYDHSYNGMVSVKGETGTVAPPLSETIRAVLTRTPASQAATGLVHAPDVDGAPTLVAYDRSAYTQWTATTSISAADLDGPLYDALRALAATALALLLPGAGVLLYLRREIETPIDLLQSRVEKADKAVATLSERLLQVQEDEHQRIAQELHDSTAQHLVGAILGVADIERKMPQDPRTASAVQDVRSSIELALNELRAFSYLLHPRDLGRNGLSKTLSGFVGGFVERTALRSTVTIDPAVDGLPFDLQRSLLRITQEALANVYRHANASRVDVAITIDADRIALVIRDDGRGTGVADEGSGEAREGVGMLSMRGRLIPFGGELVMDRGPQGTTVRASVPLARDTIQA